MKHLFVYTGAVLLLVTFSVNTMVAQDPAAVGPNIVAVLLENDRVRVFEATLRPGEKLQMHSHPRSIVYFLSDFKLKSTYADGKTVEAEAKQGTAAWREPITHEDENIGTTVARVLVVEMKRSKRMGERSEKSKK